jgi:WD40 repeat protein
MNVHSISPKYHHNKKMIAFSILTLICFQGLVYPISASNVSSDAGLIWRYPLIGWTYILALSADGQYIVSGGANLSLLNNQGQLLWNKGGFTSLCVAISGDGQYVVAGGGAGGIFLYNREGDLLWKYDTRGYTHDVEISQDGQYIAAISSSNDLILFDNKGTVLWKYPTNAAPSSAVISADGHFVAGTGYESGHFFIYLLDSTGKPLWKYQIQTIRNGLVMSQDARLIAVGATDNYIHILDHSGNLLWKKMVGDPISAIAVSVDGQYIAAASKTHLFLFSRNSEISGPRQ